MVIAALSTVALSAPHALVFGSLRFSLWFATLWSLARCALVRFALVFRSLRIGLWVASLWSLVRFALVFS